METVTLYLARTRAVKNDDHKLLNEILNGSEETVVRELKSFAGRTFSSLFFLLAFRTRLTLNPQKMARKRCEM